MIPMAIIHVRNQPSCRLGQVGGIFLDGAMVGNTLDQYDHRLIRRKQEALYVCFGMGKLLAVCAIGVHAPQLSFTQEGDTLATCYPNSGSLTLRVYRECLLLSAISRHGEQHLMPFILDHTVIAHLIDDRLSVGRDSRSTYTSHRPQGFGGHQVTLQLYVIALYHFLRFRMAATQHECRGHCHDRCFPHRSLIFYLSFYVPIPHACA